MLDAETVDRYLVEILEIPDWKLRLETDKLEFLKTFTSAHVSKVYFQNISWSAVPKPERQIPTIADTIQRGIGGGGGTCVHLNYYIKLILESLGFDTFNVGAECPAWSTPRSHMATVVRFPSSATVENELYLVDIAFGGRPFLQPVPLHRLPHVSPSGGGFLVEYRFNAEKNVYERFATLGCPVKGKLEPNSPGALDYFFDLTPRTYDDMAECFEELFSPRAIGKFLDSLLLFRVTRVRSPLDFDYVCCRNIVLIEGSHDSYQETIHKSYDSMLPAIKKYFPKLNWSEVQAAFDTYEKVRADKV